MLEYIISGTGVIGAALTSYINTAKGLGNGWYECIKPTPLAPPNWVFGLIWPFLYLILFITFANVIRLGKWDLIGYFSLLLILNVLWTWLFFVKRKVSLAAAVIIFMIVINLVIINLANNFVKLLLIPHLLWIIFASILNIKSVSKAGKCLSMP